MALIFELGSIRIKPLDFIFKTLFQLITTTFYLIILYKKMYNSTITTYNDKNERICVIMTSIPVVGGKFHFRFNTRIQNIQIRFR